MTSSQSGEHQRRKVLIYAMCRKDLVSFRELGRAQHRYGTINGAYQCWRGRSYAETMWALTHHFKDCVHSTESNVQTTKTSTEG